MSRALKRGRVKGVKSLLILCHEEPRPQDDALQTPAQLTVEPPLHVGDGSREGRRVDAVYLNRFHEAESVLRKSILAAQRVLGKNDMLTLQIRTNYARVLYYKADDATLDDLTTLEDLERVTRRVLGGEQPLTVEVRKSLQNARTALCAREVRNLIL